MTITITPLPTPPSSSDPTTFDTRADAFLAALPATQTQQNNQNIENNSINSNVNTKVQAALDAGLANAATNATTATNGASTATTKAGEALASKNAAAQSAIDAKAQADAAAATSGLPNMAGKGGQFMRANAAGTGLEFTPGGTLPREARTANAMLSLADIGKWIDCTGSFTQTLAANATLTAGWHCRITNSGTSQIPITPSGGELIDGLATRILYPGERRLLHSDGLTLRTVEAVSNVVRRPLFAAGNGAMNAGSNLEAVENITITPTATSTNLVGFAANGTNIIALGNVATVIGSSPDGRTWTNRTTPATYANVASDGSGFLACSSAGLVGYSAAGTSWAAATALPGATYGTSGRQLAGLSGGRYAALASASTLYLTVNNGTAWTTETTPVASSSIGVSAGLFVIFPGGSNYRTSPTGATGSWTAGTPPTFSGASYIRVDFDGSLIAWGASDGTVWRSTNTTTWTQLSLAAVPQAGAGLVTINGTLLNLATGVSLGNASCHNGKWVYRRSLVVAASTDTTRPIGKIGNVFLLGTAENFGAALLIDATATDATTGIFD